MIKIICIVYIAVIIGMTIGSVGKMPESPQEPYSWWLPFLMSGMLIFPAILGYLAGKDDAKNG